MTSSYDNYSNYSLVSMATRYPLMTNIGDLQQSDYVKLLEAGKQNTIMPPMGDGFDDLISEAKADIETPRPTIHNAVGQWNANNINMYLGPHLTSAELTHNIHPQYYGLSNVVHQSHNSVGSILSLSSSMSVSKSAPRKITKPRIATTFWESEKTTCFQVQAHKVVVSRRESDDYVNGTKLLNVTGMTRGKRDGLLKTEKGRVVIRNGPMNLKGVWIPFNRASEIARNEGVDKLLYPLFVNQIRDFFQEHGQELRQEPALGTDDELDSATHTFIENELTENSSTAESDPAPFYFP